MSRHETRLIENLDGANDNRAAPIGRVKPKPDLMRIISHALGQNVRFDAKQNYLLTKGQWVPASLTEIMQAVNRKRKAIGYVQITLMPEWEVI